MLFSCCRPPRLSLSCRSAAVGLLLARESTGFRGRSFSVTTFGGNIPLNRGPGRLLSNTNKRSIMSSAAVSRDLPIKEVEEETKDDTAAISQNLGLSDGAGADAGANAQDDIVRTGLEPDPESEIGEDAQEDDDSEKVKQALARLPPACLNTYLRTATPPIFASRTCRIASILENRYPLQDPTQPYHKTKNPRDTSQPPDDARGRAFVQSLGIANAKDVVKMLRWNDKYGIRFMRLSSEMFPFASHEEYGGRLGEFAGDVLGEVGKVVMELGHRVTVHPGQFTQLGSPREVVSANAMRDLEYHAEMLSLLKLSGQQDRDAVMILHMGGAFGDKAATLDRFRANYAKLSPEIQRRLVLENDDVVWTVHDLLPVCEELNIPLVLDFHHHNINFDPAAIREGTLDIIQLFPRIKATWSRKGITQKMHYSEPQPSAITPRERRRHSGRVQALPPCDPDMDLMIEAKDKEQAVFDLMRTYKLPGFERVNDIVPYEREDQPAKKRGNNKTNKNNNNNNKKNKGSSAAQEGEEEQEEENEVDNGIIIDEINANMPPDVSTATAAAAAAASVNFPEEELGMGGPLNRVYWPVGMEEFLGPKKRVAPGAKKTTRSKTKKQQQQQQEEENECGEGAAPGTPGDEAAATAAALGGGGGGGNINATPKTTTTPTTTTTPKSRKRTPRKKTTKASSKAKAPSPPLSTSSLSPPPPALSSPSPSPSLSSALLTPAARRTNKSGGAAAVTTPATPAVTPTRRSARRNITTTPKRQTMYMEDDEGEEEMAEDFEAGDAMAASTTTTTRGGAGGGGGGGGGRRTTTARAAVSEGETDAEYIPAPKKQRKRQSIRQ